MQNTSNFSLLAIWRVLIVVGASGFAGSTRSEDRAGSQWVTSDRGEIRSTVIAARTDGTLEFQFGIQSPAYGPFDPSKDKFFLDLGDVGYRAKVGSRTYVECEGVRAEIRPDEGRIVIHGCECLSAAQEIDRLDLVVPICEIVERREIVIPVPSLELYEKRGELGLVFRADAEETCVTLTVFSVEDEFERFSWRQRCGLSGKYAKYILWSFEGEDAQGKSLSGSVTVFDRMATSASFFPPPAKGLGSQVGRKLDYPVNLRASLPDRVVRAAHRFQYLAVPVTAAK